MDCIPKGVLFFLDALPPNYCSEKGSERGKQTTGVSFLHPHLCFSDMGIRGNSEPWTSMHDLRFCPSHAQTAQWLTFGSPLDYTKFYDDLLVISVLLIYFNY